MNQSNYQMKALNYLISICIVLFFTDCFGQSKEEKIKSTIVALIEFASENDCECISSYIYDIVHYRKTREFKILDKSDCKLDKSLAKETVGYFSKVLKEGNYSFGKYEEHTDLDIGQVTYTIILNYGLKSDLLAFRYFNNKYILVDID